MAGREEDSMDADKPGREGDAREESGRREGSGGTPGNRFETFGPVTSLEPDGTEPIGEEGEVRERLTVSVTWESVSVKPRQPEPVTDADRESAGGFPSPCGPEARASSARAAFPGFA